MESDKINTMFEGQEYTSANTSINHVPAIVSYIDKQDGWIPLKWNLDIGAGKYYQLMSAVLRERQVINLPYDPYNVPQQMNLASLELALTFRPMTVTISNVLCVIKEQHIREEVLQLAQRYIDPQGKLYVSIYTGNGTGQPAPTKAGWQNNQSLEWYLPEIERYFSVLHKTKKFLTGEPKPLT